MKNFIEKITENAIQTHVIVGNHDAYYKNTNQVNSVNELYGETPYLHIYDTAKTVNLGDKLKVCFIRESKGVDLHQSPILRGFRVSFAFKTVFSLLLG